FKVLDDPSWLERSPVRRMSPEQQSGLQGEVGEALFLLARANMVEAAGQPEPKRSESLQRALELNRIAQTTLGSKATDAIASQRGSIEGLLKRPGSSVVPSMSPHSAAAAPGDRFLLALDYFDHKLFPEARDLLIGVTREQPQNVSA